ncbi:TPA: hypothetical protein U0510_000543 [Streptococcus suis]|nr:hypothetical protein [Streptococcus suis]HEM2671318.1 hypothetical protein [Streptococcus suis]HEM5233643.1 hypothetical protein [Streptococcus suis]
MEELNLSVEQTIFLIIVPIPLVVYKWHQIGRISYDIQSKKKVEGESTDPTLNANYEAYIWLAGKRYN